MATDDNRHDARFDVLLADYHEVIAQGVDEASFWEAAGDLPADLRERLQAAGACVRELHVAWHSGGASTLATQDELTPLPVLPHRTATQPKQIGRFRIERELGRGGNGLVLLGIDPQLGRRVAIKVPLPEVLVHSDLRQRFLREAEIAARLHHPNLLAIHESGESGLVCYIAYEYCAGPNLAEWLREQRTSHPTSMATIVKLMISLADAVQHAHARGVLHRDLKPSNVLLAPAEASPTSAVAYDPRALDLSGYVPKVADFGLAKLVEHEADQTRTGTVLGTLLYMSPEQAEGRVRDISVQSDVYALGAILYELLTTRPPLRGENDRATLHQILLRDPVRPSQTNQSIPRDLEAICLKCLAKLPAARYLTAAGLADDLRRHQQGVPTTARPTKTLERAVKWVCRRPVIAGLSALLAVAIVTIIIGTTLYNAQLSRTVTELRVQREIAREHERSAREYAYGADMMLAYEAWERSAPIEAKALLDRQVPAHGEEDLRRFEWYHLKKRFEETSTVVAHQSTQVWSLASSPAGELFATGDPEGVIRLWHRQRRALVRELRGHAPGQIDRLLFMPDRVHLVSAGDDATIRWWNVNSGENTLVWREHTDWVGALAVSPDGAWIVSGGGEGRVLLWNAATQLLERELYRHSGAVRWIVFSPKEPWLVSAGEDGKVRIWDYLANAPPEHIKDGQLPLPENADFQWHNAEFRPDGSVLYAGSREAIYEWDVRPGVAAKKIFREIQSSNDKALAVGVIPKLNALVEAGHDVPALVMRSTKSPYAAWQSMPGHSDAVRCLVTLADGATVLSGSQDGDVRQWDHIGQELDGDAAGMPSPPRSIAWSPDSDRLWVLADNAEVFEINFNPASLDNRRRLLGDCQRLFTFRDKNHLLGIDSKGMVHRWNGETEQHDTVQVLDALPQACALDSTGALLAYGENGSVKLTTTTDGAQRWSRDLKAGIAQLEFMRNGSLGVRCENGVVYLLSPSDGRELAHSVPHKSAIMSLAESPNGEWIVTASRDNKVRILDARSLQMVRSFARPRTPTHVWFIDRGERLLVHDGRTFVVHSRTGQDLLRIPAVGGGSKVSPDGRWLATPSRDVVRWLPVRVD